MSEFKIIQERARIEGTGLVAYMDIGYADLVATLGEPTMEAEHKIDAQWFLEFADGTVATIYNYKTGRNYIGPRAPAIENLRDWHIGGRGPSAADRIAELFPQATVSRGRIFSSPIQPKIPAEIRKERAQAIIAALAGDDIPHDQLTGEELITLGKDLIAEHTPEAGQPQVA